MRRLLFCVLAAVLAPAASAQVELTAVSCDAAAETTAHVRWPAAAPVWEFDVVRPGATNRPDTPSGAGLEIRNVSYRGRRVLARAGTPLVNVEYAPGGCACFRDWTYDEATMVAGGAVAGAPCLAQPTAGSVASTCDTGVGGTPGTFAGVAFEDYGTELVVTSHMMAGWYRYLAKWHVYADGRIWPEFSFSAAQATCTEHAHRHHVYWRFDFDLEGTATNDVLSETTGGVATAFTAEAARSWGAPGTFWSVRDAATGAGYDLVPSTADRRLPVDAFSQADALVLRYRAGELSDRGTQCTIDYSAMVNGEALGGQDVVLWYRSGALHDAGNPYECDVTGPTLRAQGFASSTGPVPATVPPVEVQAATPNPFAPETTVRFRLAETQAVRVVLLDALGRHLATLFDGTAEGGRYETVRVDGRGFPAGTYVVRVEGARAQGSTRVALQR